MAHQDALRVHQDKSQGMWRQFEIPSGVRQGCTLAPALFNYVIDWTPGQVTKENWGVSIHDVVDSIVDADPDWPGGTLPQVSTRLQ